MVALVALDWHQQRLASDVAAAKLAQYVRDIHDGMAMHLDIGRPPCCRAPLGPADSSTSDTKRPRRAQRALPAR